MVNTNFSRNRATIGSGGGMLVAHKVNLCMNHSEFYMNFANSNGGAVFVQVSDDGAMSFISDTS